MSQNPPKTDVDFYKKAERPKHDKGNVSVQIHQPLNASITWGEESKDVEVTDCPINVSIGNANAVGTPVSALSSAEATPQGNPFREAPGTAEFAQNVVPPAQVPSAAQTMRERAAAAAEKRAQKHAPVPTNTPARIVTLADLAARDEAAGSQESSQTTGGKLKLFN